MSVERCSKCGTDIDTDFNVEGVYRNDEFICGECEAKMGDLTDEIMEQVKMTVCTLVFPNRGCSNIEAHLVAVALREDGLQDRIETLLK